MLESRSFRIAYGNCSMEAELNNEIVEAIKHSKKVILRITYNNGLDDTVDIPSNVLAEWKQVINTEK